MSVVYSWRKYNVVSRQLNHKYTQCLMSCYVIPSEFPFKSNSWILFLVVDGTLSRNLSVKRTSTSSLPNNTTVSWANNWHYNYQTYHSLPNQPVWKYDIFAKKYRNGLGFMSEIGGNVVDVGGSDMIVLGKPDSKFLTSTDLEIWSLVGLDWDSVLASLIQHWVF